ncbi:MAG: hypothetical protein ABI348_11055 [Nitrososphaera sp.]
MAKKPSSEPESETSFRPPTQEELDKRSQARDRHMRGLPPEEPKRELQGLIDTEPEAYKFEMTPEMERFKHYQEVAGLTVLLETESDQNRFVKEFNSWIKAGRPAPKMPELVVEEDPVPMKLYRIRHRGKQYVYWRDTRAKLYGKVVHIRQTEHHGADKTQKFYREQEVIEYTIPYNKELGTKLVEDSLARCVYPTFYFVNDPNHKYSVKPEDFNADLDQIIQLHREKKYDLSDSTWGCLNTQGESKNVG